MSVEVGVDRIRRCSTQEFSVRLPKEFLGLSPGYYMALSNREFPRHKQSVRIYWNVRVGGAVAFMKLVTARFNSAQIPFRLKILNHRGRFTRCDAAVLYVLKSDWSRLCSILQSLQRRIAPDLNLLNPVFTKPIGPGVSIAEDPPGDESFGNHRCGWVAEALINAYGGGKGTSQERLHEVSEVFRKHGTSLHQPFLNPGSRDIYPPLDL